MMPLVDPKKIQKILLARKVGQFLDKDHREEERSAVEGVARMLADDVSHHVRSTLAFCLRQSRQLPIDIAERIACDSEDIASPFLAETPSLSDEQMAQLVPRLEEAARVAIARRRDLGNLTAVSIASNGEASSVTYLLQNEKVKINERSAKAVAKRFIKNQNLLDELSRRENLPLSVVKDIIDRVSEQHRNELITRYKIAPRVADLVTGQSRKETLWQRLKNASRQQVHALAVDLRGEGRLDFVTVADLAEKGAYTFLESALAITSELTVAEIRDALTLQSREAFVNMIKRAKVPSHVAPRILKIARHNYSPA